MEKIVKSGRYLFALAIIGFGMIQFITANFPSAFLPMPASFPGRLFFVYLAGIIFLVCGICIFINKVARIAAALTGLLFFLFVIFPHLPKLISTPYDPGAWTITFEALAIGSGAFMLAGSFFYGLNNRSGWNTFVNNIAKASHYFFAIALVIFGIQHIMYSDFIVTLIPSWIPAHNFWSYVIQAAFLAGAVSIFLNVQVRLATFLLGIMFLLWVIFLHAPRVATDPGKETEWTSLFIAMAMSGTLFIFNQSYNKESKPLNLINVSNETIKIN